MFKKSSKLPIQKKIFISCFVATCTWFALLIYREFLSSQIFDLLSDLINTPTHLNFVLNILEWIFIVMTGIIFLGSLILFNKTKKYLIF